ncbi:MAG: hypothetical protein KAQ94_06035 [Arcobacteraceae bacterium]|nr:hypothetical protein [Arcobacteraceae bacterium]
MFGLNIFGAIVDGVKTYATNRQKIKQAKIEGEIKILQSKADTEVAINKAKIKLAENGQMQDYNLDKIAMQEMKNSYLDEALLIAFLYPIFDAYISKGFDGLSSVPTWYLSLVVGMVVVKYGMRGMLKDFANGKYKGLIGRGK